MKSSKKAHGGTRGMPGQKIYSPLKMFEKILKAFLSVGSFISVVGLGYYSASTGNQVDIVVWILLGGALYGATADDVKDIVSLFKKPQ